MAISKSIQDRFWSKVKITSPEECWLWTKYRDRDGYGVACFNRHPCQAHRFAYALTNNLIPSELKGKYVLHSCDNPPCVNPKHLRLGTPKDNMDDKHARNRAIYLKGEENPAAKLKEKDILCIRQLRKEGRTLKEIADKFEVDYRHISDICLGKRWGWL